jgi:predicted HTH domain antitoxin
LVKVLSFGYSGAGLRGFKFHPGTIMLFSLWHPTLFLSRSQRLARYFSKIEASKYKVGFLELKLPKTLIDDVDENELKLYLAIMLYKERKISVGQAAKLSGLSLLDFMYELGKHKVSFTNITEVELEEELRRIK